MYSLDVRVHVPVHMPAKAYILLQHTRQWRCQTRHKYSAAFEVIETNYMTDLVSYYQIIGLLLNKRKAGWGFAATNA